MTIFLVAVGVVGLVFRRPLARFQIAAGKRTRLPEGRRSLEEQLRVQDIAAVAFIVAGVALAVLGLLGIQPFGVPLPGIEPA